MTGGLVFHVERSILAKRSLKPVDENSLRAYS